MLALGAVIVPAFALARRLRRRAADGSVPLYDLRLHELRRATTNYHDVLFANIKRKAEELATTAPTGRAEGDEHHRRGSEVEL